MGYTLGGLQLCKTRHQDRFVDSLGTGIMLPIDPPVIHLSFDEAVSLQTYEFGLISAAICN